MRELEELKRVVPKSKETSMQERVFYSIKLGRVATKPAGRPPSRLFTCLPASESDDTSAGTVDVPTWGFACRRDYRSNRHLEKTVSR